MAILQVTAPAVALTRFHTASPRAVTTLSTLIRYTLNGVPGETYDARAVPAAALIHGRVTR